MVYDALGRCVTRTLQNPQETLRPTPTPPATPTPHQSPTPTPSPTPSDATTYYIYDGEKPILEWDSGGASAGTNVYGKGIDEILERSAVGSDGQWYVYFPQQNHEGSVTLLSDSSGNVLERYRYDAFGAPTIYTGAWGSRTSTIYDNRFLFTGREYAATYRSTYNAAFNFYEYRARAYNPKLGRFMSEDPKLFDAGDYNLFRYCHNDPIDLTDPMGLNVVLTDWRFKELNREELRQAQRFYDIAKTHAITNKDGSINKEAAAAFKKMETSDNVHFRIAITKDKTYDAKEFKVTQNQDKSYNFDIKWNPNLARTNTNDTRNSPSGILLHEGLHGAEFVANPRGFINREMGGTRAGMPPKTGSPEEQRVLHVEQRIFPHLRNEGVRTDLEFKNFFRVPSPELGGRE